MRRAMLAVILMACSRRDAGRAAAPVVAPGDAAAVIAAPIADAGDAPIADAGAAAIADAGAAAPPIVQAPMRWTPAREQLTLAYRRQHSDPAAADLAITPRVIVLHYTGGSSAAATRGYFDHERIEAARAELARAGAVNVSAHFVVDRDGTIYQLQPADRFARHCIGLNHLAIGIENAGDEARWKLTDAQVAADAALIRYLVGRYPITHLLGHHEVMGFRDHPYFVERDRGYRNSKPDPGAAFMAKVRARVADLSLSGP